MRASPRVFTIILNYECAEETLGCVTAVRDSDYRNQFLIVVDNGSSEDSFGLLEDSINAAIVLRSPTNSGYGAGNNLGIRFAIDHDAERLVKDGRLRWPTARGARRPRTESPRRVRYPRR